MEGGAHQVVRGVKNRDTVLEVKTWEEANKLLTKLQRRAKKVSPGEYGYSLLMDNDDVVIIYLETEE